MARKIYNGVSLISEWTAKVAKWLIAILIVSICYDVFLRYIFNDSTIWSYVLSYMLGATFTAWGIGYVYRHNGNVRVDILYNKFSPKVKLIIDIFFTLVFFFPLYSLIAYNFGLKTWEAYVTQKIALESIWYPVVWPYMAAITLGFGILVLQGIANFLRDVMILAKGGKEPW